ncbi:transketolase [Clostridium grantii]|uniref:Transketolase n=1 Tax=Clostridium grantii DSM 8605 TaxID=1121316 RepID=A0A1M5UAE7_9CLOT|nr:transketolase [Clostridium grantii]SHH59910.1 transketolase [Clostridium grantii DSM 8605]
MSENKEQLIANLKENARNLRQLALTMIHKAQSGHPGGSLSASDIMAALYFYEMKSDPKNPTWDERDRFVLSKGHVCPILYSALIEKGFINKEEVYTLREFGSILQGHPDMKRTPGVEISTGSLGQGVSAAVGMAIALKRDGKDGRVFTLLGDGECNEGQVWEAVEAAFKYKLDNLTIIIDNNGIQNDDMTEKIMPLRDLAEKFNAFGCETRKIDGHKMEEIVYALDELREIKGKPKCIVAKCVKGKYVSFMENVPKWHGLAPNDEEFKQAIKEIREGN